jgi:HSP20 family protein
MRDLIRRNRGQSELNPFERLVSDLFEPFGEQSTRQTWVPEVNIEETDEAYEVTAELPGIRKDEVQITVEQNLLSIGGERKWDEKQENRNFHRIERGYGRFLRTFALPQQVAADQVKATFEDGVLHVSVPKSETAKPRRVQITESIPKGKQIS